MISPTPNAAQMISQRSDSETFAYARHNFYSFFAPLLKTLAYPARTLFHPETRTILQRSSIIINMRLALPTNGVCIRRHQGSCSRCIRSRSRMTRLFSSRPVILTIGFQSVVCPCTHARKHHLRFRVALSRTYPRYVPCGYISWSMCGSRAGICLPLANDSDNISVQNDNPLLKDESKCA